MKKIAYVIMIMCMVTCLGCSRQSVSDAEYIDQSRAEKEGDKDKNDAPTTATEVGVEQVKWVAGKSADISEAEEGQLLTGGGYELTVLDSRYVGDSLANLDEITGSKGFKENIINRPHSNYDSEGNYTGKLAMNFIAVKVRIKCTYIENERRGDNVVCFSPNLYYKSGNSYNDITTAEGVGYDKYQGSGKDALLHTFKEGEEIETWMVLRYASKSSSDADMYMYSGFVNISVLGDGFNDVKDGTYMIKLGLK